MSRYFAEINSLTNEVIRVIVCNDKNNYKIIHSLRSHGWDRGLNNNKNKQ